MPFESFFANNTTTTINRRELASSRILEARSFLGNPHPQMDTAELAINTMIAILFLDDRAEVLTHNASSSEGTPAELKALLPITETKKLEIVLYEDGTIHFNELVYQDEKGEEITSTNDISDDALLDYVLNINDKFQPTLDSKTSRHLNKAVSIINLTQEPASIDELDSNPFSIISSNYAKHDGMSPLFANLAEVFADTQINDIQGFQVSRTTDGQGNYRKTFTKNTTSPLSLNIYDDGYVNLWDQEEDDAVTPDLLKKKIQEFLVGVSLIKIDDDASMASSDAENLIPALDIFNEILARIAVPASAKLGEEEDGNPNDHDDETDEDHTRDVNRSSLLDITNFLGTPRSLVGGATPLGLGIDVSPAALELGIDVSAAALRTGIVAGGAAVISSQQPVSKGNGLDESGNPPPPPSAQESKADLLTILTKHQATNADDLNIFRETLISLSDTVEMLPVDREEDDILQQLIAGGANASGLEELRAENDGNSIQSSSLGGALLAFRSTNHAQSNSGGGGDDSSSPDAIHTAASSAQRPPASVTLSGSNQNIDDISAAHSATVIDSHASLDADLLAAQSDNIPPPPASKKSNARLFEMLTEPKEEDDGLNVFRAKLRRSLNAAALDIKEVDITGGDLQGKFIKLHLRQSFSICMNEADGSLALYSQSSKKKFPINDKNINTIYEDLNIDIIPPAHEQVDLYKLLSDAGKAENSLLLKALDKAKADATVTTNFTLSGNAEQPVLRIAGSHRQSGSNSLTDLYDIVLLKDHSKLFLFHSTIGNTTNNQPTDISDKFKDPAFLDKLCEHAGASKYATFVQNEVLYEFNTSDDLPAALATVLDGFCTDATDLSSFVLPETKIEGLSFQIKGGVFSIRDTASGSTILKENDEFNFVKVIPQSSGGPTTVLAHFTAESMEPFAAEIKSNINSYQNLIEGSAEMGLIPHKQLATKLSKEEIEQGSKPSTSFAASSAERLDVATLVYKKGLGTIDTIPASALSSEEAHWRSKPNNQERNNDRRVIGAIYNNGAEIDKTLQDIIILTALQTVGDKLEIKGNTDFNELSDEKKIVKAINAITKAKAKGGVSSIGNSEADAWEKTFSKEFQEQCKKCGILSGRNNGSNVGLRTAYVTDEALEGLKDLSNLAQMKEESKIRIKGDDEGSSIGFERKAQRAVSNNGMGR